MNPGLMTRQRHQITVVSDVTGLAYLQAHLSDASKLSFMYTYKSGVTYDGSNNMVNIAAAYGSTGVLGDGTGTSAITLQTDRLRPGIAGGYAVSGSQAGFNPTVIKTTVSIAAVGPRGRASRLGNVASVNNYGMQGLLANYQLSANNTFADTGLAVDSDGGATLRVVVVTYDGATTATGQVLNHALSTITPAAMTNENGSLEIMRSTNGTARSGWAATIGLTALPTAGDLVTFMAWGSTFYGAVALA